MKTILTTCICAFLHVNHKENAQKKYSNYNFEYFYDSQIWEHINNIISKISCAIKQIHICAEEILLDTETSSPTVFSRKNKTLFFLKSATRIFKNYIDYSLRIGPAMKLKNNLSYDLLYIPNTKTKD